MKETNQYFFVEKWVNEIELSHEIVAVFFTAL